MDYMLARYYEAGLGRFLSADPGNKVRGNLRTPQRWNLYTYVRNNPLVLIDPDGREEITVTITTRVTTPTTSFMGMTFLGDSGGSTFRSRQSVKMETDPSKGAAFKGSTGAVGMSVMLSPVVAVSDPNRQPTTMKADASRDASGTTTMTASGNESNPLVPGSPGITYNFSLAVGSDGGTKLTGAHDGFPGYTVDVTREDGTTETIYEHDPEETGEGPGSLIPPAETEVNQTGKLPAKKE
jgi:RHS repeat-associated protein